MIIDYILAQECKNEEAWFTCHKCGKCGRMHMVRCNNPDCPVPADGYPTGRHLEDVIEAWNRRAGEE